MYKEITPEDCRKFTQDGEIMDRYKVCANACLLSNFYGSIPPVIQEVVADYQDGDENGTEHQCDSCTLSEHEHEVALVLLLDALL